MMPSDDEISRTFVSLGAVADGHGDSGSLGHYLLAVEGTDPGRIVEVRAETLTIGRDARQSLVFADSEISRVHARVSLVRGEIVVEDLGSTNGTFVDGERIAAPTLLAEGGLLRLGQQVLKYERRDSRDVARSLELRRDLAKASGYLLSLLPAPLEHGPVRASWRFLPSAQLGGDAFGYYWLDRETFVFYLMDVSGHGAGRRDALGWCAELATTARAARRRFHRPGGRARQLEQQVPDGSLRQEMFFHAVAWRVPYRNSRTLVLTARPVTTLRISFRPTGSRRSRSGSRSP